MTSTTNSNKVFIITQCFLDVDSVLSTIFRGKLSGFCKDQTLEGIFQLRLSTAPTSDIRRDRIHVESYVDKVRSEGFPFGLEVDLDVPVAAIFGEENMRVVTFIVRRLVNGSQSLNTVISESNNGLQVKKIRKRTARREIKNGESEQDSLMQIDPTVFSQGSAIDVPSLASTTSISTVKHGDKQESESLGSANKILLKKRGRGWSRTKNPRGRPPKRKSINIAKTDNLADRPDGVVKKRRGRPSGSKNRNATVMVPIEERKKPGRKAKPKMMTDFVTEDRELVEDITDKEPSPEPLVHYDASTKLITASGLAPLPKSNYAKDILASFQGMRENGSGGSQPRTEQTSDPLPV